jgi:hypothetical protein
LFAFQTALVGCNEFENVQPSAIDPIDESQKNHQVPANWELEAMPQKIQSAVHYWPSKRARLCMQ